jgi:hypothetical protein
MRLIKTFRSVTVTAALVSLLCFIVGEVLSYLSATPTGASVELVNIAAFLLFAALHLVTTRKPRDRLPKVTVTLPTLLLLTLTLTGCTKAVPLGGAKNAAGTKSVTLPTAATGTVTLPTIPEEVLLNKAGAVVEIREKLFIAQTNEIYLNPEEYLGRTIKLEGLFKSEEYPGYGRTYCFVLRYGPGCCGNDGNAGFEVAWPGESRPLPAIDEWVEAVGTLASYEEEGYPYLYLALSSLNVLETRGAEFVNQ